MRRAPEIKRIKEQPINKLNPKFGVFTFYIKFTPIVIKQQPIKVQLIYARFTGPKIFK